MIIQRSEAIGLDWAGTLAELQQQDWDTRIQEVTSSTLVDQYPSYYTQPFHAYKQVRMHHQTSLNPAHHAMQQEQ